MSWTIHIYNAVLYAYLNQCSLKTEIKPYEHEGVSKIKPNGAAPRVVRQSGIFTIHIDHSYRKELRFEWSHYGINELSLFPDLDGLSDHVNWIMENSSYWTGEIDKEVESITE